MKSFLPTALLALALGMNCAKSLADVGPGIDGVALVVGQGQHADMGQVALTRSWNKYWPSSGDWHWTGYWEGDVSYWRGNGDSGNRTIYGVGITPVFRFEQKPLGPTIPYVEVGIGAHLFSGVRLHDERRMGTLFEFGDHLGMGVRFGAKGENEVSYRFQHYSNAGISSNNGGVDFHQLRVKIGLK